MNPEDGPTFQRFRRDFATTFEIPVGSLEWDTGLFDVLDFDSFDALRLLIWLEDRVELLVPDEETPPIFTVGEAFVYGDALRRLAIEQRGRLQP